MNQGRGPGRPPDPAAAAGRPDSQVSWLTPQAARVVEVLLASPARSHLELTDLTGMPGATVHLVLTRLTRAGWLGSSWQRTGQGRPQRLHILTAAGSAAAPAALAAARAAAASPAGPLGLQEIRIIQVFSGNPRLARCRSELADLAGIPETTVRKALSRLTEDGLLAAAAEAAGSRPGATGRRRHLYTLTPAGLAAVGQLAAARAWVAGNGTCPRQLEAGPG
jgi:predicted ArsR family transcriptional regulator